MANGKRKRGPKTLKFSYAEIGELVGLKPRTVGNHSRDGTFDPTDLHSLVEYIVLRTDWSGRARTPRHKIRGQPEHAAVLDDQSFKADYSEAYGGPEGARAVMAEVKAALNVEFPDLEMHVVPGQAAAKEAFEETLGKGDHVASFKALIGTATAHCDECNHEVLADTLVVGYVGLDEKRLCGECKERSDSYGS